MSGKAASSPGSPFNEPEINSDKGGIGGPHYNESSQYDVACHQVSTHQQRRGRTVPPAGGAVANTAGDAASMTIAAGLCLGTLGLLLRPGAVRVLTAWAR